MRVPKFAKFLFITLAVLFLLLLIPAIGVNIYLQSPSVQARMRTATGMAFGVPVQFQGAAYTPWSGLTLKNISAFDPSAPSETLLDAKSLNFRVALLPLLSRKVVVTSVTLDHPVLKVPARLQKLALPETRKEFDASTTAPMLPEPPPATSGEPAVPEITTAPEADTPAPPEPTPAPSAEPPPRFTVEIHRFEIRDGQIEIEAAPNRPKISVRDLIMITHVISDVSQTGTISIGGLTIADRVAFSNLVTAFVHDGSRMEINDLRADWAGGKLRGALVSDPDAPALAIEANLENVSIERLLRDARFDPGRSTGSLNGEVRLASASASARDLEGKGRFFLTEAAMEPLPFIRQFGEMLGIEELKFLELQQAELVASMSGGEVTVEEMVLRTQNLAILTAGRIGNEGALDLQNRLLLREEILRRFGGLLDRQFGPSEPGFREVQFQVSGTLSRPRTDLLEKVTGIRLDREINRFINNLFGQPKKDR